MNHAVRPTMREGGRRFPVPAAPPTLQSTKNSPAGAESGPPSVVRRLVPHLSHAAADGESRPRIGDMTRVELGNDASPNASYSSRLPAAFILCRTWLDFKDAFPVDDFNGLPDAEIEAAIRAFGRGWLKDNEKRAAKLIAEPK